MARLTLLPKLNFNKPTVIAISIMAAAIGIFIIIRIFAATFDPKVFMQGFAPGTTHEDFPLGVPLSYDWQSKSTIGGKPFNRPNGDYYTNLSNAHPANTRVELKDCQY